MSSLSCHLGDSPFSASTWGIFSCGIRTQLCHVGSSSLTRDRTRAPAFGQQNLSQWTTFTYWTLFLLLLLLINDFYMIVGNLVYSVHYCVPSTWFTVGSFKKKKNLLVYFWLCWIFPASCCCSVVQLCPTFWDCMDCSTPGFPVLHHLPELVQTHVHWDGDAIQSSHPLLNPSHSAFNLSQHPGLFQWAGSLNQVPNFSFSISPSNEYSRLTSFRIDWFDLLAAQGSLKSLLQRHSSKASIFWHSAFFIIQLSHPYVTTGKTIALTIPTFVGKVMSLLFSKLSRFVMAFLPRSKHLLISWVQSRSTVILEPKKIKPVTVSIISPSICHEVMGPDAVIFTFWILNLSQLFHSPLSPSSPSSVPLCFLP